MKIISIRALCFISIITACATANAQTNGKTLEIGGKQLTLQMHTKCPQPRPTRKELAKYLAQYDPSGDPRSDIRDETPWTIEEIEGIRADLVRDGFQYPNGHDSVITWMDFDGDGICDFTASAGIGGMRSSDRMFLFRGMPNGKFKLVESYLSYMDTSITVVPYIPIKVFGEKLPVLANGQMLMQWQSDRKQFVTCETLANATSSEKRQRENSEKARTLLAALCPHAHDIATWAVNQLPHGNKVFNWHEPE